MTNFRFLSQACAFAFMVLIATAPATAIDLQGSGKVSITTTCDGINFGTLSIQDGVVAARLLKYSYSIAMGGKPTIVKLAYTGAAVPTVTTTSGLFSRLRPPKPVTSNVGNFAGKWDGRTTNWVGSFAVRNWVADDDAAVPIPVLTEEEWEKLNLLEWGSTFVQELRNTGRSVFASAQSCAVEYTLSE
jgi:hypothetical protein